MSRVKNIARGLMSGYAVIGASVLLTMASVPLALKYLSKEEFGLWAVVSQIAGYLNLVDLGMSGSIGRLLIDYKEARGAAYGSMVKTGFLVLTSQGVVVAVVGMAMACVPPAFLSIPNSLHTAFFWLLAGQALLMGVGFPFRIYGYLLYAHQRLDILNYGQVAQFVIQLLVMWAAFALGAGIYGQLIGAVVGTVTAYLLCVVLCLHLGYWPNPREWGPFSRQKFLDIFGYGKDVFMVSLGAQLINSSQTILASRLFGVDLAAVWSVATKAFNLASQFVWRVVTVSVPALAEMHVQADEARVHDRFRALFNLTTVLAAVAAVLLAVCNEPFLALWTHGKIAWPGRNDWLVGLWLVLLTQVAAHANLIVALKCIRRLKFMYFAEGTAFVGVCLALSGRGGFSMFLACSICCTTCFTFAYTTLRIARLMRMPLKEVLGRWQRPMILVLVSLVPLGAGLQWLSRSWSPVAQLVLRMGVVGLVGGVMFFRLGLTPDWAERIGKHLPSRLRLWFGWLMKLAAS